MKALHHLVVLMLAAAVLIAAAASCERYEAPPRPTIEGLTSGILDDPRAPVVIDFGTPIDPDTLFVKIALFEPDVEGALGDEDADPDTELRVLVRRDPLEGDLAARADIDAAAGRLTLVLDAALPVGPKLVLLVEGGLRSPTGTVSRHRVRVPFSYVVKCAEGASTFESGTYFVLLDVEQPLGTQIQLLAYIDVDPATGALVGQFTNADRNVEQKCPTACPSTDVCRLLPSPECVAPSTRAGSIEEWPDFVPNAPPPTGYSFLVQGCAVDDGAASGVLTAPTTMVVESPKVTVEGLTMTASFAAGADGIVRATGSLTADVVRLGTNPLGAGKGSMAAVRLPDDRVPPNVPRPPARADGGAAPARGPDAGP
ncbi:MAG: hypothetical protein KF764_30765 [Labilithrix sp.]|nr:hypothetical protein [Labilithrix sp.]